MPACWPAGMYDFQMQPSEQRCSAPGSKLGVRLEMLADGSVARTADSPEPSEWWHLDAMLSGGLRNRVTRPVGLLLQCSRPFEEASLHLLFPSSA